jgi:hypothetical protein
MKPGIKSYVRLAADQPVAASTALVDLGAGVTAFSFVLPAGKEVLINASLPFSVGATGGFKFQLTSSQTLVDSSASWEAIDGVTASPGAQVALTTQSTAAAPFANAWAVAGNHQCNLLASLKGHATLSSTITVQFACNSAANAINVLKGAWMELTQL